MHEMRVQKRRTWEIGPPRGWADRRRKVERRKPETTDGSYDEFESLVAAMKARSAEIIEQTVSGWDIPIHRDE